MSGIVHEWPLPPGVVSNEPLRLPDAARWRFEVAADRALDRHAWQCPRDGQARVLVVDTLAWRQHTAAAEAWLDCNERMRAARFRHSHDRIVYVLAHALWRKAVGRCLELEPLDVPMVFTPLGQPVLPGTGLATSLSHSGRWVAIAIGTAEILGVDIERAPAEICLDDLIANVCHEDEAHAMHALPPDQRELALLQLWTRKEALLKAFGVGLTVPPHSIRLLPDAHSAPPPAAHGLPPCTVRDLHLPAGMVGALAAPANITALAIHVLQRD